MLLNCVVNKTKHLSFIVAHCYGKPVGGLSNAPGVYAFVCKSVLFPSFAKHHSTSPFFLHFLRQCLFKKWFNTSLQNSWKKNDCFTKDMLFLSTSVWFSSTWLFSRVGWFLFLLNIDLLFICYFPYKIRLIKQKLAQPRLLNYTQDWLQRYAHVNEK